LEQQRIMRDMLSDAFDPAEIETGEELLFSRKGLQHGLIRKLRRGQFTVQAELDLHGLTVAEARQALAEFLADVRAAGARCVRIIHGKGYGSRHKQPVLKNKLNGWLQQRDEVLAFCSARQVDGGTGAVYVLLKRS
jgi:DNA-nicking Smr family endonuclease